MKIFIKGKPITIDPSKSIGKGGEADIYNIGNNKVLKLFKQPDHIDLQGFPNEQLVAKNKLREHQTKLRNFPKLPNKVIVPIDLATNSNNYVVGYTMTYLKNYELILQLSNKKFRQSGIHNDVVDEIFSDLHQTLNGIHQSNVIVGDFNDLNVMIKNNEACIIDADSFQFDNYMCSVFTEKFVDPLLCDNNETRPILIRPHNEGSDWYAFAVLLFQSLLFVGPYGGVYKGKNKINHAERPLKRITIFDKEVKYPKPATHYGVLPDDLLQHFYQIFKEDKREIFPSKLLNIKWKTCGCGTTHARNICPNCAKHTPASIKESVRGNVSCSRIFQTAGIILIAQIGNNIKYLYHSNNEFIRENGAVVKGILKPTMRFRIRNKETLVGERNQFITFTPGEKPQKTVVDCFNNLPLFDVNSHSKYWIYDGQLLRSDVLGPKYIGAVLKNQTLFWIGEEFGFGFYRAGNIHTGFVFNSKQGGLNDNVDFPIIPGQLIDATCYFAGNWVWFLVSFREHGQTINRCMIINNKGKVKEIFEAKIGSVEWLNSIRGKCAAGNFLLVATDDGIVKVESNNGLNVTKEFPDTEPFVNSGCHLYPGQNGLYVVSRKEIKLLKIS